MIPLNKAPLNQVNPSVPSECFQVWELYEDNRALDVVDPRLEEFDSEEVLRAIKVALLCTQGSPHQRPPMARVVALLTGDVAAPDVVTMPR